MPVSGSTGGSRSPAACLYELVGAYPHHRVQVQFHRTNVVPGNLPVRGRREGARHALVPHTTGHLTGELTAGRAKREPGAARHQLRRRKADRADSGVLDTLR